MKNHLNGHKQYLLASDFDQTLSFNDSGQVLAEMLGISNFQQKVEGLTRSNLVHQGAELAYLLRHDPEFRSVRREHLVEAGRRVRLKDELSKELSRRRTFSGRSSTTNLPRVRFLTF